MGRIDSKGTRYGVPGWAGMIRRLLYAIATPAMTLVACQQAAEQTPQAKPANDSALAAEPSDNTSPVAPADAPATKAADDGKPDLTPPKLVPEPERGEKGARNLLLSFARTIELKEFGQAWAMLSPADKAKWSKAKFAAMFADLGTIAVAVPTGTMEGAAGSLYYTAPVRITANDKAGRPVRIEGEAVLRRVNDVDGATEVQLRWHFERLTLNWTH